jgi:hypothetical protein
MANTTESLAMLPRPGNAGSNTVADHAAVLGAALRQIPGAPAVRSEPVPAPSTSGGDTTRREPANQTPRPKTGTTRSVTRRADQESSTLRQAPAWRFPPAPQDAF